MESLTNFPLAASVLLVGTVLILLYLYLARFRNHWKNQHVPHESYALLFGPMLKMLYQPFHDIDIERYRKYGKVFGIFESGRPSLFVADPKLVKRVLVKDFLLLPNRRTTKFLHPLLDNMLFVVPFDRWKVIRRISTPAFSSGKLRKMMVHVESCTRSTIKHLREAAERCEDLNLSQFYGNFTLDLVARCAFGTMLESHSDKSNEFVSYGTKAFGEGISFASVIFFLWPGLAKLLRLKFFNQKTLIYFKKLSLSVMNNRRRERTKQDDFLQLMVDAQESDMLFGDVEEEKYSDFDHDSQFQTDNAMTSKILSEDEALAQCMTFLLAGQGTTQMTIAFTLYLLALNQDAQEKLRKEVDGCFEKHGPNPDCDVIFKLQYLHGVVSETLRMFPPGSRHEREATEDYVLGDTGIKVPRGCVVVVPVYALHHDPEYFPDPFTFKPERFYGENASSIQPYTYLPFGAGPRNCIGLRLALQAVKFCLFHSIRHAEFVRTSKTMVPLNFFKGFGIISSSNVTVGVRKRSV
ncbi:cytochrome P450 3A24 [Ixodes scapularis]|uniref:cytochrome P450 3A24 n=1 Tax=Ixodes scapularis TaxID=6945 RepID=UPI001A9D607F|nr:cytochrome P450 3A24 [Ixodes scapularis]